MSYLQQLEVQFVAVEEPLQVGDYEGCRSVSKKCGVPIILDESVIRAEQFPLFAEDPGRWIINIRVSKMGGIMRVLAVAARAKACGIPIVVGAQVGETSILTRAALAVADQYWGIVMAQEGAFGTHLLEYDLCDPPVMFGQGGCLNSLSFSTCPGLGLAYVQ